MRKSISSDEGFILQHSHISYAMKLQNTTLALFADATATCDQTVEINENCFIFALLFYSLFVRRDTVVDAIWAHIDDHNLCWMVCGTMDDLCGSNGIAM